MRRRHCDCITVKRHNSALLYRLKLGGHFSRNLPNGPKQPKLKYKYIYNGMNWKASRKQQDMAKMTNMPAGTVDEHSHQLEVNDIVN
ncbi:uncharacterized protein Dmoj_GI26953 [Drosophila mojavensis]|uniref:Uncharacterized protein n=1 Tax=Drosophila mojavensis TaxID=7230 RepID=A0A0Q9X0E9_DROMO|nr:uncharacterized protein Dmoj_GI26953 [Drosophila mojavensis]